MLKKEKLSLEELMQQALVKDEDKPYEVPGNWVWTILNNVAEYKKGPFGSAITKAMFVPKGVNTYKVYEQGNAIRKDITYGSYYISAEKYQELKGFTVYPNDLIVSCAGTIGEVYKLPDYIERGIINQALLRIKINEKVNSKFYLLYFGESIKTDINGKSKGTAIKNIPPFAVLKNMPFPLPPLLEQQRIVDLIESLFGNLDRAKELVQNALDSFENRKSAILHKAFTGELTDKWREENGTQDSYIMILNEMNKRKELYDNLNKKNTPNFMNYSINGINRSVEDIPNNWAVCPVGILCDCIVPGRDKPRSFTGDIPWITIPEIENDHINNNSGKLYLSLDEIAEVKAKIIPKDSVVMSCVGRFGISALVDNECVINQQLHAFLPSNLIDKKYLMHHIRYLKDYMLEISTATTIAYLNKEACNSLPIALPPIEEQQEIVRILDNLLENEQKAKELCNVIDKIELMKKSILARAFRGELSTNNPDEESALELLKEVLRERAEG